MTRVVQVLPLGPEALPVVAAELRGLVERRERMSAANAALVRWGPVRSVPEMEKLGLRREQIQEITTEGRGFTASEFRSLDRAIGRLSALRDRIERGEASVRVYIGDPLGEPRSFAPRRGDEGGAALI